MVLELDGEVIGDLLLAVSNGWAQQEVAAEAEGTQADLGWVLAPASALLPHELRPLVAVPIGFALAWLGYALWSERREHASEPVPGSARPQVIPTAVK